MPQVKNDGGNLWKVVGDDGKVLAGSMTNAQAWRLVDELTNEHLSRAEQVSDWVAKQKSIGTMKAPKKKRPNSRKAKRKAKQREKDLKGSTKVFRHVATTTFNSSQHKGWKNRGSFGAAGPCKRIDPKTGEVIEVIPVDD